MGTGNRRKSTSRRRWGSLVLFLAASGVVFWGRHDLLWGIKGYALNEIDYCQVERQSSLPSGTDTRSRPAKVVGIPDYKHALHLSYGGTTVTCYRMLDFGNRLVVCSGKGLKSPEAIDEIIKERTIRGRLEKLGDSPWSDRLRESFQRVGRISIRDDAFVLHEDPSPLPSPVEFAVLVLCLILSCLFAWRLIKF